jgi:hypothetical protein
MNKILKLKLNTLTMNSKFYEKTDRSISIFTNKVCDFKPFLSNNNNIINT